MGGHGQDGRAPARITAHRARSGYGHCSRRLRLRRRDRRALAASCGRGPTTIGCMTNTTSPAFVVPPAVAEPGWTPSFRRLARAAPSFPVSGQLSGPRLRVAYFRRDVDGPLMAKVWFGPGTEGPPGCAHGGSIAAVLDEAMGAAAWMEGHKVVAAHLRVDFRLMVPIGTDATIEECVAGVDGRKIATRGRLLSPDGSVFAEARGVCVVLDEEQARALISRLQSEPAASTGPDADPP